MTYFNFFYRQQAIKKRRRFGAKEMIVIAAIFCLVCAGVYCFYLYKQNMYKSQMTYLENIQSNSDFNAQYNAALAAKEANEDFKNKYLEMTVLSDITNNASTGNDSLLKLIDKCAPDDIDITRIQVSELVVNLSGRVPDIESLTKFQKNLDSTGKFSSVLIILIDNKDKDGDALKVLEFSGKLVLYGGIAE